MDHLARVLARFVVLPKWAAETLALWIVHTYAFQLRDVSTYLGIESPEKRCGKTTLLGLLTQLVHRPIAAANISSPAFFRVIQETQPTLLIDEGDTFLRNNEELRGILNAGYTRPTAFVYRVRNEREVEGGELRVESADRQSEVANDRSETPNVVSYSATRRECGSSVVPYSCWCPKAIAAIGRLPETLADRCIVVRMQRKTRHERCARLRELWAAEALELRRKCARFVADNSSTIACAQPKHPEELHDRAAELWEPLLALADLAGENWPERARRAATGLTGLAQESNPTGSLLFDLFVLVAIAEQKRIFSRTLVEGLQTRFSDRPWMESLRGKPVTSQWLSQQLKPYGIRPKTMRIGEERAKGYEEEELMEVLKRYTPWSEIEAFRAEHGG